MFYYFTFYPPIQDRGVKLWLFTPDFTRKIQSILMGIKGLPETILPPILPLGLIEMFVNADLRRREYRSKSYIWCAIDKFDCNYLDVRLRAIASLEQADGLPCIKLHRNTLQRIRRLGPWGSASFIYSLLSRNSIHQSKQGGNP
jgi:hypothetical protein